MLVPLIASRPVPARSAPKAMREDPQNLQQLLDRIGDADHEDERVKLDAIVEKVGRRSFGPLLLLAGVITASPLSGIPGMPTLMALLVLMIAAQLLLRRDAFWLPQWMLRRTVSCSKRDKALSWLRPVAGFIDRFLRPRLSFLVGGTGTYAIAVICVLIAMSMPPLELLPFAATLAGAAIAIFGLALIAHDGLVALLGFLITAATMIGSIAYVT
jgi:hypothetical protein